MTDFITTFDLTIRGETHVIGVEEYTAGNYSATADNDIEYYGESVYHFLDEHGNITDCPVDFTDADWAKVEFELSHVMDALKREAEAQAALDAYDDAKFAAMYDAEY
jgi:hypothetical protein